MYTSFDYIVTSGLIQILDIRAKEDFFFTCILYFVRNKFSFNVRCA